MKKYYKPSVESEKLFETSALACGKTTDPPPGSWHTASGYDTFSGHFGPGFGGSESMSGTAFTGWPPGSASYPRGGPHSLDSPQASLRWTPCG